MARLTLAVLGPLQILLDDVPIRTFESDKARALLVYLAAEADRAHRRDALAGLLWPDRTDQSAHHNLSQTLLNVRRSIGDLTSASMFLLITRDTIQFNRATDCRLDLASFTALLTACAQHAHRHAETCTPCARQLDQANALYHGSFLAGFFLKDSPAFEEWALLKREWLHRSAIHAFTRLADYYEQRGDYQQAQRCILRQLELDSWREEAHRQLMRVLVLAGQRSAALAQYLACCHILADELGLEPSAETTDLYERILADQLDTRASLQQLSAPAQRPHNLPPQPTPFIGREHELAQLADLLLNPACRLISVVGPGGIGKTRLALQAAAEQIASFTDGVCYVALAPLQSAEALVPAIAEALGLALTGGEQARTQLFGYLSTKDLLLVLDNFEHLLDAIGMITECLARAADVTLLVTTRERLNVRNEWVLDVEGLRLPADDLMEGIESYSAIALFQQSACRAHAGWTLTANDAPALVRICRLVEGMPLGVELAAAWVRVLSCAEIAGEIEQSMGFLASAMHDLPERHRSLRAVVDHSWRLLDRDARQVFQQLAIFRGGFRREAAEAVVALNMEHVAVQHNPHQRVLHNVSFSMLNLLAALVDKSLLRRNSSGRYELHEFVRQYAGQQLRESGTNEQVRARHLAFFLALAEQAEPELVRSRSKLWMERLEAEAENLRGALEWCRISHDAERWLRLAGALWTYWEGRGLLHEGLGWLEGALAIGMGARVLPGLAQRLGRRFWTAAASARAQALIGISHLSRRYGDYARALARAEECAQLCGELGDRWGRAAALQIWGRLLRDQGDYARGEPLLEQALAIYRELGDQQAIGFSITTLAILAACQDDHARATALNEEALALFRASHDPLGSAFVMQNLGGIAFHQGQHARATTLLEESLTLFREASHRPAGANSLDTLGKIAETQGDYVAAQAFYQECLALRREMGNLRDILHLLDRLRSVAEAQGDLMAVDKFADERRGWELSD